MPARDLHLLSEETLIQQIKTHNARAFETLYNRYWDTLFIAAHKVLRDKELSRDVVQEVFTDLWTRRHTLRIEHPQAYFYQAVRYRVLMQLRRLKLSREHLNTLTSVVHENHTENTILFNELNHSLEQSISGLPDKCREVFTMSRFENLSHAEIARKLNLSVRTVETHIHHALKHLKVSMHHLPGIAALLATIRFFK